jgi:hypothetical protein
LRLQEEKLKRNQGFQGLIGNTGLQGPAGGGNGDGNTGAQGFQGNQGFQGLIGNTGAQGNQGFQGAEGLQGFQGAEGIQGFQGVEGLQGFQGLIGITGNQGSQGNQGNIGIQGFQGYQGDIGIQGFQGSHGFQGITGVQGLQGPSGGGTGSVQSDIISLVIDASPDDIQIGKKAQRIIPYDCSVTDWYIVSGQTGSISFDVKKSTFSNYPLTSTMIISGTPSLINQNKNSSPVNDWATISSGDMIEIWVDSNSGIQDVSLFLKIQ